MKILYVAQQPISFQSASTVNVIRMCQALGLEGHDVTLLLPSSGRMMSVHETCEYYGVEPVFRITRIRLRSPAALYPLAAGLLLPLCALLFARYVGASVVYTRHLKTAAIAPLFGLRCAFEAHQPMRVREDKGWRLFRWSARSRRFIALTVITDSLRSHFQKRVPRVARKIHVLPDAADLNVSSVTPDSIAIRKSRLQVGYFGNLYLGKGAEILAQLARNIDWADFHLIGGKPEDVKKWGEALADFSNIRLHGHFAPGKVPELQKSFDVLIAPYQEVVFSEGGRDIGRWMSPLKIFEYMAAGKPIVASDLPVLHEVLRHGQNALLCAPNDLQSWIRALERLYNNPCLRFLLSYNALSDFLTKYTWEVRAKKLTKIIEQDPPKASDETDGHRSCGL